VCPFDQSLDQFPMKWKARCLVEADVVQAESLGNHVVIILPLENIGIGQVERLPEDDLPVLPMKTIGTHRQSDFSPRCFSVQGLEKHEPRAIVLNHKRVSYKLSLDIRHIITGDYRVFHRRNGRERNRGIAAVDSYGPNSLVLTGGRHYVFGLNLNQTLRATRINPLVAVMLDARRFSYKARRVRPG